MSSIEILQKLYQLFPRETGVPLDFLSIEKFLRQNIGVKKAFFLFRQKEGLKTQDGKAPLSPAFQKTLLDRLDRFPGPWIGRSEDRFQWLGFWPVAASDGWMGCYALGRQAGKAALSAEEGRLMELLADRTGLFLEERRLWQYLEQADRQSSLGFLSAAMIHEIRNPLAALSTLAQLLPQKKGDESFMESFEKLMLRETGRLTDLTENFLGFLKSTQEKAARLDLAEVVAQIMDLLKPLFAAKGIRLKVSNSNKGRLYLMGDERQIKSLILNLSKNALESAGSGGAVAVSMTWLPRASHGPGPWALLKVENSGAGIPREKIKDIFTPYFSLKEKGAGLGLAICQRVVENHGGIIQAESSRRNTVFKVFLPALPRGRE